MKDNTLQTVISGSYRRHLPQLYQLKHNLEQIGISVLSPVGSNAINPQDEFVFLDADPVQDKRILQDAVFAKIRTSSFLVLANFDGYIGIAASMEIGYALSMGLQILTVQPVSDPNINIYTRLLTNAFPKLLSLKNEEIYAEVT